MQLLQPMGLLRPRMLLFSLLLYSLDCSLHLREEIVDWWIVVEKTDLELWRILDKLLHVPACGSEQRHPHWNVSDADRQLLGGRCEDELVTRAVGPRKRNRSSLRMRLRCANSISIFRAN